MIVYKKRERRNACCYMQLRHSTYTFNRKADNDGHFYTASENVQFFHFEQPFTTGC